MSTSTPPDVLRTQRPVRARPIDPLVRPLRAFFRHRLAGAALLLTAAVVALAWASSPWGGAHHALFETPLEFRLGRLSLEKSLHHWINDGVMAVFFFVVGLELKREVIEGELSTMRKAALPALCALGGMAAPALVYLVFNRSEHAVHGWGIPMATDIAFALGVTALLGSRVKPAIKVLLTAIAVADDLGAIVVIATVYTDTIWWSALGVAAGLIVVAIWMNVLGVRHPLPWLMVGVAVWLAFLQSGVHATLAAVIVAFTIPARTRLDSRAMANALGDLVARYTALPLPEGHGLLHPDEQHVLEEIEDVVEEGTAPLQRIEHALLPFVTFAVLPLFALANAGVAVFGGGIGDVGVFVGVVVGLVVGKPLGITLAALVATRLRLAELPAGVSLGDVAAVGILGGIGFTMSLFIGELAFDDAVLVNAAKLATLTASLVAALLGLAALWWRSRPLLTAPVVIPGESGAEL